MRITYWPRRKVTNWYRLWGKIKWCSWEYRGILNPDSNINWWFLWSRSNQNSLQFHCILYNNFPYSAVSYFENLKTLEFILMTSSSYIPILITCKCLHKYDRAYRYVHVTKQQERLITIRLFACSRKMSNNFINDKLIFSKLRQPRLLIENSNISDSQLQLANTTSLICFLLSRSNHSSNCLALFPLSIWHESTFGWRNDQNRSQKAIKLCS
jgi:hypothetical protein